MVTMWSGRELLWPSRPLICLLVSFNQVVTCISLTLLYSPSRQVAHL
jgi:hypothetical protein